MNEYCDYSAFVTTPTLLKREFAAEPQAERFVADSRAVIERILCGDDDRLLVIVGPCSVHDPAAALDYATQLSEVRRPLHRELEIMMRVYFEKPRTCLGWKGLINDPHLDESHDIDTGLRIARKLMLDVTSLNVPIATEFLDSLTQALHRGSRLVGSDRRSNDRIADSSRNGVRFTMPCWI